MTPGALLPFCYPTGAVLGGLALFIYGMSTMGDGLKTAAGRGLRKILERATRHRLPGMALGTLLGLLIQSSAATVMLVGFISAGLMSFSQSIPVVLGANIGTTFSMQLISFRLGDLCWVAITAGLCLRLVRRNEKARAIGDALLGFGLLFLGMNVMSDAIRPYRNELAPLLSHADGSTFTGMLVGIGIATLITSVIQSSGATIGMVFAMISAGVITRVEEAYPIILGANIGTCATAMLGSIGAPVAARRSALSHLFFNIFSALFGILTAPLVFRYISYTAPITADMGPDEMAQALIHQCANANTIKMVISAFLMLPAVAYLASFVRRVAPQRGVQEEPSHLNPDLLNRPEDALQAALRELARLTRLCRKGLTAQAALFIEWKRSNARSNREIERTLDTIKIAMHDYLMDLANHPLSRRQAILLTLLYHGVDHLERISDHLDHMSTMSASKRNVPAARFDKSTVESLFTLARQAHEALQGLEQALSYQPSKQAPAIQNILDTAEAFKDRAAIERTQIGQELSGRKMTPVAALYRAAFLSDLSRIVKHARALALEIETQDFRIKKKKLGRESLEPATDASSSQKRPSFFSNSSN